MRFSNRTVNFLKWVVALSASLFSLTAWALFGGNSWERDIANQSQRSWTIKVEQPAFGNVWFLSHCVNQKNGSCLLPPQQTMRIKYTTDGKAKGRITFSDYEGNKVSFNYQSAPQIFSFSAPVKVIDTQPHLAKVVISKKIIEVNTHHDASFKINENNLKNALNCIKVGTC